MTVGTGRVRSCISHFGSTCAQQMLAVKKASKTNCNECFISMKNSSTEENGGFYFFGWENKSAIETRMATLRSPSFIDYCFWSLARQTSMCGVGTNSHAVERAIHESKRHHEEDCRENVRQCAALRGGQLHRQFDGEKAEERCEFDDR